LVRKILIIITLSPEMVIIAVKNCFALT